tara:strand:- start:694 stop:1725 length:1032 start_codon:yes stop_codon:yes gene_type:complete
MNLYNNSQIDTKLAIKEFIPSIDELNNYHLEKTKNVSDSQAFPLRPLLILSKHRAILNQEHSNLPSIISNILDSFKIRYLFYKTKCKWKAFSYQKGILSTFCVRLFIDNLKDIIIELQLRNGDRIHFLNIVYDFFTSCIEQNIIIQITGNRGKKEFNLPAIKSNPLSEEESYSEMYRLLEIIKNEKNNNISNFSSIFYTLSNDNDKSSFYCKNIKEIISCLDSIDKNVQNCIICIILNLIKNNTEIMSQIIISELFKLLEPIVIGKINLFENDKKIDLCFSQFEIQTNAFKLLLFLSKNGKSREVIKFINENENVKKYIDNSCKIIYDLELQNAVINLKDNIN